MRRGLITPLCRDRKRDWTSGTGGNLLVSKVVQALATEGATSGSSGELPWRTSFGSSLHLLRHRRNDAALAELARVYVRDALRRWVPGVRVTSLDVVQDSASLMLRLRVMEEATGAEETVEVRP